MLIVVEYDLEFRGFVDVEKRVSVFNYDGEDHQDFKDYVRMQFAGAGKRVTVTKVYTTEQFNGTIGATTI